MFPLNEFEEELKRDMPYIRRGSAKWNRLFEIASTGEDGHRALFNLYERLAFGLSTDDEATFEDNFDPIP